MRAVQLKETRGPSALELVEVAEPHRAPDEVLVEVHSAGISYPDLLLSHGAYQRTPPLPLVVGGEAAGVVRSAPQDSPLRPGMRVAAILPNFGALAECVAVPTPLVLPLPDGVDFDLAAGIPINYLTVQLGYRRRGALHPGDKVLVHGAAGGVGVAAIQLGRAWGAEVIAVASTPEKRETALAVGAHHVVPLENFLEAAREVTPEGVQIVVDPVGGDRLLDSVRILADEGRLLVIGFAGGPIPSLKVNRLLLRNLSLVGVNLGVSPDRVTVDFGLDLQDRWQELMPLITDGTIAPVVADRLPLDRAADALVALENRTGAGKYVVRVR